jgi:hypothetical protein
MNLYTATYAQYTTKQCINQWKAQQTLHNILMVIHKTNNTIFIQIQTIKVYGKFHGVNAEWVL